MYKLKVCAVCFTSEGKLYNLEKTGLREDYNFVSRLNSHRSDGLPYYLCMVCAAYVRRFKNFQIKCQKANYILKELLYKNKQITMKEINTIDQNLFNLQPTLSFCKPRNCFYSEIKFHSVKLKSDPPIKVKDLYVMLVNTFDDDTDRLTFDPQLVDHLKQENEYEEEYLNNDNQEIIPIEFPVKNDNIDICYDNDMPVDNTEEMTYENENMPINKPKNNKMHALGCSLNTDYANVTFLTQDEQKAIAEINCAYSKGKYKCQKCNTKFTDKTCLEIHKQLHEKVTPHHCEICNSYYETQNRLKTHMSEKHYQKFMCPKCPEVNYERKLAKLHFAKVHLPKIIPGRSAPAWLNKIISTNIVSSKGTAKGLMFHRKPKNKFPKDFLIYSAIGHNEQYELIKERQFTKNYTDSLYKCNLCFRGFREINTFNNHLKKHDSAYSGSLQCDICKIFVRDQRKMYKHMIITHLFRYSCQMCEFICYNRAQAQMHYRWHKNVTYSCPHCDRKFVKSSTRLTHIRLKHPSTDICSICGHSFVSEMGLYFHKKKSHSPEEIILEENTTLDSTSHLYCKECNVQFVSTTAYDVHLGTSSKHSTINLIAGVSSKPPTVKPPKKLDGKISKIKRTRRCKDIINNGVATATICEVCGLNLINDMVARKHYKTEHPGTDFLKRYMCDVCGHTTQQYNNLMVHMRKHTNEKPYPCGYCGRQFSMPSNRDRHLVVHTGEKRFECPHCHRKFTQSSAVKLHIQTVHLKIPYAPWDKKNRKRRKEIEDNIPQPEPKVVVENHGHYLNAFISYHDEAD